MSKSVFIQELVLGDDDRWRMSIGEVGSSEELSHEMYPPGHMAPYGVTIEEEMIQHEPEEIGHFFLTGITPEAVQAMEEGFADAFQSAGFPRGKPEDGMVRTWFKESGEFLDISEDEFATAYCDAFVDVRFPDLSEMTIWDPLVEQRCIFSYASGTTHETTFGSIDLESQVACDFLWNDSGLVFPVNESWEPLLNVRNTPNMFQFCYNLATEDARIRELQLEIGELVVEFSNAIKRLATESQLNSPIATFRDGLKTFGVNDNSAQPLPL